MSDFSDGRFVKSHPPFQQHPNALQVILSHDDFAIVNPLGAHVKKHKIAMFYFTLANIPPQHRSKLTAIQMLCLAKLKDLRLFGINKLMIDFVDTVCNMQSNSINVTVNDEMKKIYGTLVACLCDTLAAQWKKIYGTLVACLCDTLAVQWLGGFKEGVGFTRKGCRTCSADQATMKTKFLSGDF